MARVLLNPHELSAARGRLARVESWKGHNPSDFGELRLADTLTVARYGSVHLYEVFLFDYIILCCKISPDGALRLKGRVFLANFLGVGAFSGMPSVLHEDATSLRLKSESRRHMIRVTWTGDRRVEEFDLLCDNADDLAVWQTAIELAMDDWIDVADSWRRDRMRPR